MSTEAAATAASGAAVTTPVAAAAVPSLEILAPRGDALVTPRAVVHLLGRTSASATVRVNGEPAPVFATGVFARDGLALQPGYNRITVEVTSAAGASTVQTLVVERVPAPPAPEWPLNSSWLDGGSLEPVEAQRVAPGEAVEIAVRATPGRAVQAQMPGQNSWQPLLEHLPGRYRARLAFETRGDVEPAPIRLRVMPAAADRSRPPAKPLLALSQGRVGQWRTDPERLYTVGAEGLELLHGLHEVRLGGPFLGEMSPGTQLAATGEKGAHLRVLLSPGVEAWAPSAALSAAARGTRPPQAAFTNVSVSGGPDGRADLIQIPLAAAVPCTVRATRDAAGRHALEIEIHGAHHATTWITHRADRRVVQELVAEQAGPARVRLTAWLQQPRLWGWRIERAASVLRVHLAAAPAIDPAAPLKGLRIALEAGHGGPTNLGAVGATGTPEKDFNRWTTDALAAELLAAGAKVIDIRPGDTNPPLRERARLAEAEAAQLYVSVHANAADTAGGYLRVSGASTYYKHAPSQPLAAAVHRRLLAASALLDFGLVGNFNYAPLRLLTAMPSVLVEQAFVSHPGDEAQLLDPAFRARLAQAVRLGLEDALRG